MLSVGGVVAGFRVDSVADVADVGGRLWRMTYVQNGAELIWIERVDEVKTFVVSFKTIPEDDTGVAHIVEHSVLCGSKKFPIKDPFREMRKNSVSVFMNAMTGNERTYYPFATRNDKDFLNLMGVYLDAVFHPNSMEDPSAFLQEGCHFSIDAHAQTLSCNGVVYNEMKGAYSDIDSRCVREVLRGLYPNAPLGKDSGGSPDAIPELTYRQYKSFYGKYYHASNARFFVDGSVDIETVLRKLDECLRDFNQRTNLDAHGDYECPDDLRQTFYDSQSCSDRGIVAEGWSVERRYSDVDVLLAEVISSYLTGTNEAPLKTALLKEGLCKNVSMFSYDRERIAVFLLGRDVPPECVHRYHEVCLSVLKGLLRTGFDGHRLAALLEKREFLTREVNTTRPRGLVHFSRIIGPWQRGEDPVGALDLARKFSVLRSGIGDGLYEQWVRDCLLENRQHFEVRLVPEEGYSYRVAQMRQNNFNARLVSMAEGEKARICADEERLKAWQGSPDELCNLLRLPSLSVKDMPASSKRVEGAIQTSDQETLIRVKVTCQGVAYVFLYFPLNGLSDDLFRLVPLYAGLLGKLPTSRHSAEELQTAIYATTGRLTFTTLTSERGSYLRVALATLEGKLEAGLGVLCEVLNETRFDDVNRIARVLRQRTLAVEEAVASFGHRFAIRHSSREFSRRWTERESLRGIEQLRTLTQLEICSGLRDVFEDVARHVICRHGLLISMTENVPEGALNSCLASFKVNDMTEPTASRSLKTKAFNGFRIMGDTGFAGVTAILPQGVRFHGSMLVAAKMLALGPLHESIRERGGAYGVGLRISQSGIVEGHTYRDPVPQDSVATLLRSGELLWYHLKSFGFSERFVVSTIASLEPYQSQAVEAERLARLYLNCRGMEDVERVWREVLETTEKDVHMAADVFNAAFCHASVCIVGGERQTRGYKDEEIDLIVRK